MASMSELDELQAKITHLRMWLGIFVVIDLSLMGWFTGNYSKVTNLLLILDILAIMVISGFIWALNLKIETRIRQLRDL